MKKMLLLVALTFAAMQVMAADVDVSAAQSMAQRFLMSHNSKKGFDASTAPAIKWVHQELNSSNVGKAAYYVVNTDGGFVVVAGDDRAQEILAYGSQPLDNMSNLPENMRFWLGCYKAQMELLQSRPGMKVQKNSIKAGAVTVNKGATITANGKPSYTQSNQDGTSTVGYAIACVGNASYANNATVAITGGTIKGTTITIAENGATAGGVVTATSDSVNYVTVPAGYEWVE
jgi:hypothetical protein